jgi:hypothetical protein
MVLSKYDEDHIDQILRGHGDWFSAHLLRLCAKADVNNLELIRRGFPDHVALWEKWYYKDKYYEIVRSRMHAVPEDADA